MKLQKHEPVEIIKSPSPPIGEIAAILAAGIIRMKKKEKLKVK